jgi:hypothetical protein
VFVLPTSRRNAEAAPSSFEATVACAPSAHGEQAGLYAYASTSDWVKLVLEGAGGEKAQLVFASQKDGTPFLHSKIALSNFQNLLPNNAGAKKGHASLCPMPAPTVSLKLLTLKDNTIAAFWRPGGSSDDSWIAVPRGEGWLQALSSI